METLFDAVKVYASLGWRLVPLHAPIFGQWGELVGCTCGRESCPSPGKHPKLQQWQTKATADLDILSQWFGGDGQPAANVGVVLGPQSGIIDIEVDSPAEMAAMQSLFRGDPPATCRYISGRDSGAHYLFRWDDSFATCGAVVHYGPLGIRLGGGARGAQSVLPPSRHKSGRQYSWIVGPDSAPPAALPDYVITTIINTASIGDGVVDGEPSHRQKLYTQPVVLETIDGRDNTIYAEACAMWREQGQLYGPNALNDTNIINIVNTRLLALNALKCRPPLADDTVVRKSESARQFIAKEMATEKASITKRLTDLGLVANNDAWEPGLWRAAIVRSSPPVIRLYAPFLPEEGIELTIEEFESPRKVHMAVLAATAGTDAPPVCLDAPRGAWKKVWEGRVKRDGTVDVGLKGRLLASATTVGAPPELRREAMIAASILQMLTCATANDGAPGPQPHRVVGGDIRASFTWLYRRLTEEHPQAKYTDKEVSRVVRGCGAGDCNVQLPNKRRLRLMVFTPETIAALQALADAG